MKKRTEITIATSRLLMVSKPNRVIAHCELCNATVHWLTTDEAAIVAQVNSRMIYNWADTEQLHTRESTEGLLMVCLNSLEQEMELRFVTKPL